MNAAYVASDFFVTDEPMIDIARLSNPKQTQKEGEGNELRLPVLEISGNGIRKVEAKA